jgi:acyl dehydratase
MSTEAIAAHQSSTVDQNHGSAVLTELTVGDVVATATFPIARDSLVRYAGASGDFNPIHYRDDIAAAVGLPGVLAHGMLTMGLAVQPVVDWVGDPGRVIDYQVRFTRPVTVDPVDGATLEVSAKVGKIDVDAATARIDLTVSFNGDTVLGKAQAVVSFPAGVSLTGAAA